MLSAMAALGLAEWNLRRHLPTGGWLPYPRNSSETVDRSHLEGVQGTATFSTNEFGCRGPSPRNERHRLLVIGGSTTACGALDEDESWPALVMRNINARLGEGFLWVTNSGMPGRASPHHVAHARHLVPQIPHLDHVLVYCGLNDVGRWLFESRNSDGAPATSDSAAILDESFWVYPRTSPWYRQLALSRFLEGGTWLSSGKQAPLRGANRAVAPDTGLGWVLEWQRQRELGAEARLVPNAKLETLDEAVAVYATNLSELVRKVRASGAEPILMAQSMRFGASTREERNEIRVGSPYPQGSYLDPEQLQVLVDAHNTAMARVARVQDVAFVDLPRFMRATIDGEKLFYDSCHLTERGALEVARIVARVLATDIYASETGTQGAADPVGLDHE